MVSTEKPKPWCSQRSLQSRFEKADRGSCSSGLSVWLDCTQEHWGATEQALVQMVVESSFRFTANIMGYVRMLDRQHIQLSRD